MSKSRLLLVYGGRSSEHEVSVRSATEVLGAIDRDRFDPILLGIRREGGLRTGSLDRSLSEILLRGERVASLRGFAEAQHIDVVFPLLHGPYGEDGSFQGLLEVLDLPYVGSGVLASSLCMDKASFKRFVSASPYELPVVPDTVIDLRIQGREAAFEAVETKVRDEIGLPCFVKPANQGSSVGVSKVNQIDELEDALESAARYDDKIVIERGIDAREVEVAVLGDGGPDTQVSSVGEIVLPSGTWYDYESKYENDVASLGIPADLDPDTVEQLRTLALKAFRAAGCDGLARVDFLLDRHNREAWLNEVNTMPGFTSISMYPKLMEHSGVPYSKLITRLAELAMKRHVRRNKLSIDR